MNPSSRASSLFIVGAVLASASGVEAFDGSISTCATGIQVGPNLGKGLACVDFSVSGGEVNTECLPIESETTPFRGGAGVSAPLPGATWCATVANYDPASVTTQRNWGYCCPLAEDVTEAPVSTPTVYVTSGGYVPENTVCRFPITKAGVTYDSCVSVAESGPRIGATPPKAPVNGDNTAWCYTGPGALPVDYNLLAPADKLKWGYCREQVPTVAPTTKAPTVKVTKSPTNVPTTKAPTTKSTKVPTVPPTTKAPTLSAFVASGGYAAEGSACTFPFKNLGNGRTYTACAPYANAAGTPLPYIAATPPAQPTVEGVTNSTWCYTGAGDYSPTIVAKRKLWAFCGARVVPVTDAPTSEPETDAPTTEGTSAPSGDVTSVPTPEPTVAPSSAAPTTVAPTLPPGETAAPTVPTVAPTLPPSVVTGVPTAPPTNASTNGTNGTTRSPTSNPTTSNGFQQTVGVIFGFASVVVAMIVA